MIIKIKVKPNADRELLEKISENEYKAEVKEPAKDNKVNTKLINLLSKELGISYRQIRIKNPKSKVKFVEIKK